MLLPDELLLLAYTYRDRAPVVRPTLDLSLTAAALVELALAGRLTMDGPRPVVADPTPTGDRTLDAVLRRIIADAPDDVVGWLEVPTPRVRPGPGALYQTGWSGTRRAALTSLVDSGALRRERRRVLGIFPRTRFVPAGGEPAAATAARRRLFAGVDLAEPAQPRTAALAILVAAAGLIGAVFAGRPEAEMYRRIADLVDRSLAGADWTGSESVHHSVLAVLAITRAVAEQTVRAPAAGA